MTEREDEFDGRPDLIKKRARSYFWSELTKILIIFTVLSCLGILVTNAYFGAQTRGVLVDCTTPGGKCFVESQKRGAEAIAQLIKQEVVTRTIVVTAVACAKVPENDTLEKVQLCVDTSIKEK